MKLGQLSNKEIGTVYLSASSARVLGTQDLILKRILTLFNLRLVAEIEKN
jgi:hypothetical protein